MPRLTVMGAAVDDAMFVLNGRYLWALARLSLCSGGVRAGAELAALHHAKAVDSQC